MSKKTNGYKKGLRGVEPGNLPGFFQSQEEWEGQQEGYKDYLLQKKHEEYEERQRERQREERERRLEKEERRRESKKQQEDDEAEQISDNLQMIEPIALRVKEIIESEFNIGVEIRTESKIYGRNLDEQWIVSDCYLFFDPGNRFRDRLIHVLYNSSQKAIFFRAYVDKRGFTRRRPDDGWDGSVLFKEYKKCDVSYSDVRGLVHFVLNYQKM